MDDLISRQAAINEIARFLGYIDEDMIARLQIALGKLPSEPRWISVSEKPKEDGEYIVTGTLETIPDHVDEPHTIDGQVGVAYYSERWGFDRSRFCHIDAWMEKPIPYKGEEE